ncbi:MAG: putative lipoprotein with Yx(FWY)xxD motif [Acidimicrobiales bacterium]|jgi:predicted lipoprotein with Yx(FWY)xxD motif
MNLKRYGALVVVLALTAASCGSDSDSDGAGSENATADPVHDLTAGAIASANSDLGDIIVDDAGNTLYLFVPDAQGDSTCYDDCEAAWPVLGEATGVGDGLDASLLGTTERTNGDIQATYNGWPLYYFAKDVAVGDTNGQGVGDVWYVLDAAGSAIGN